jgi:serine protease
VINLSLGSQGACPSSYAPVISQLTAAGVTVVASAGNDEGLAVAAPANCSGVIAVGGVRHVGTKVGYSNVGPEVALSAPAGNCVNATGACLYPLLTTTNSGTTTPATNTYSDSFNSSLGTSFSAPLVAGTVGLMLSVDPSLTPAEIRGALKSSARLFPTSADASVVACHAPNSGVQDECNCTTSTCGAGLLDVAGAVKLPPTVAISASTSNATAGTAVALDGSASTAVGGRTVFGYQWTITSGDTIASLSNAGTSRPTLSTTGVGAVVVKLTVTDSASAQGSATSSITVTAAPTSGGGGGGGGALGIAWLLALGVAVGAVARRR